MSSVHFVYCNATVWIWLHRHDLALFKRIWGALKMRKLLIIYFLAVHNANKRTRYMNQFRLTTSITMISIQKKEKKESILWLDSSYSHYLFYLTSLAVALRVGSTFPVSRWSSIWRKWWVRRGNGERFGASNASFSGCAFRLEIPISSSPLWTHPGWRYRSTSFCSPPWGGIHCLIAWHRCYSHFHWVNALASCQWWVK